MARRYGTVKLSESLLDTRFHRARDICCDCVRFLVRPDVRRPLPRISWAICALRESMSSRTSKTPLAMPIRRELVIYRVLAAVACRCGAGRCRSREIV